MHGDFEVNAKYANGVTMDISSKYPNGVRFIGEDGWIFVSRGNAKVTASDPVADDPNNKPWVSDPKFLEAEIGPNDINLYESPEQHLNWLECIRSRKQPVAPAEVGTSFVQCVPAGAHCHESPANSTGIRQREQFIDNVEANKRVSRPQRYPYGTNYINAVSGKVENMMITDTMIRKCFGWIVGYAVYGVTGCQMSQYEFTGAPGEVKLVTLDPGHFHAALVQKTMYDQVSPTVHVYAPEGPDVAGSSSTGSKASIRDPRIRPPGTKRSIPGRIFLKR